jgi:hypothetical protein
MIASSMLHLTSPDTFEIKAQIDPHSSGVGCFDPMRVINRMRVAFPEIVVEARDPLWEPYEYIRKRGGDGAEGALRIAVRDIHERGPKILFSIPAAGGHSIRGTAERYRVGVNSKVEFPADFRNRFTAFLHSLSLQPIHVT